MTHDESQIALKHFATPEEFYEFCVSEGACKEGLAAIKGHTLADWWDTTNRGEWMMWLHTRGVWHFPPSLLADYLAKCATIDADFLTEWATLIRSFLGNPWRDTHDAR